MTRTITPAGKRREPVRFTPRDEVARLLARAAQRRDLPTILVVFDLPWMEDPQPGALDRLLGHRVAGDPGRPGGLADLLADPHELPPRSPGRPPLNLYLCAEVAVLRDLEGLPFFAKDDRGHPLAHDLEEDDRTAETIRAYVDRRLKLRVNSGAWRCAPLDDYLKRGRQMLRDVGAWPWTLAGDRGVLPDRSWVADPVFFEPLREWAGVVAGAGGP